MSLNAIQLEVLWNRLLSVANEQQTTLIRTAFSTIVRESLDLACGVFDTRGQMIGQSLTGTPGHINPMATGAIHLLNAYPPETLEPGDVLVTNDPWLTAGQVNDFTVLSPVFRGNDIVGYFSNCCHAPDIGGRFSRPKRTKSTKKGSASPSPNSSIAANQTKNSSKSSAPTSAPPTKRSATSTPKPPPTPSAHAASSK